jgi:hypothetical protein
MERCFSRPRRIGKSFSRKIKRPIRGYESVERLRSKSEELICEKSGETEGAEHIVEPTDAPAPLAAVPEQIDDVAATARATQNGSMEADVADAVVGVALLPVFGDLVFVLPECLKDLGIESDAAVTLQALQLLLAIDGAFIPLESSLELDFRDVDLGESQTTLILFFDRPAVAGNPRIKRRRAVDGEHQGRRRRRLGIVIVGESEFAAEKAINSIFTAKLVNHGLHPAPGHIGILHDSSFPTVGWDFSPTRWVRGRTMRRQNWDC